MIWTEGRLVDPAELNVSCLDRTFQHGLGLFETLRTWNRRARLLPRHLERLTASAAALGIPLDPSQMPAAESVDELVARNVPSGDARLRITLTGGLTSAVGSRLWMTAEPMEEPPWRSLRLRSSWHVPEPSPLSRHKTLNYWRNRVLHESAVRDGYDEDVGRDSLGRFVEGTRTNLFIVRSAALLTPSTDASMLPGVFRSLVLALAPSVGLSPRELDGGLAMRDLSVADECFVTNSGRGIAPVAELDLDFGGLPTSLGFRGAEGVATCRLAARARDWLESEEDWP